MKQRRADRPLWKTKTGCMVVLGDRAQKGSAVQQQDQAREDAKLEGTEKGGAKKQYPYMR